MFQADEFRFYRTSIHCLFKSLFTRCFEWRLSQLFVDHNNGPLVSDPYYHDENK